MKTLSEFLEVPEGAVFNVEGFEEKHKILNNELLFWGEASEMWLSASYCANKLCKRKITIPKHFTDDEKVIAGCIDKEWKWIVRNKNNSLYAHYAKPKKNNISLSWISNYMQHCMFDDIFQSIQWTDTEPTLIEDIYK